MAEVKFEEKLNRLQQIVEKLESNEVDLDESIKLYEEGLNLVKGLNDQLSVYDNKINEITKGEENV